MRRARLPQFSRPHLERRNLRRRILHRHLLRKRQQASVHVLVHRFSQRLHRLLQIQLLPAAAATRRKGESLRRARPWESLRRAGVVAKMLASSPQPVQLWTSYSFPRSPATALDQLQLTGFGAQLSTPASALQLQLRESLRRVRLPQLQQRFRILQHRLRIVIIFQYRYRSLQLIPASNRMDPASNRMDTALPAQQDGRLAPIQHGGSRAQHVGA